MKTFRNIIFWVLVSFALIQFVSTDKTNKPIDKKINFVDVKKTPPNVVTLLKNACYDCHSNETVYPKYAYIAPFSWSVKDHINEGREHINFSLWNSYNKDLKESMLTKTVQTLDNKSMPLPAYVIYHEDAKLTDAERAVLSNYFKALLESKSY